MSRRVVVTGLGTLTSIGLDTKTTWDSLISGTSGIKRIESFDPSNFTCQVAGEIGSKFDPTKYIEPRDIKKMDLFIQYGYAAAIEALEDSGWSPEDEHSRRRTGVLLGSGIGGLRNIEKNSIDLNDGKKISPFFLVSSLINLLSGFVSIKYGFRGPNHAVVTACATGSHAVGDGARLIKYGDADVMVVGGAEAAITPIGIGGFAASRALSTGYNDSPDKACRPWDKARDGFVMGEGAGVLVLEEYEHAKKRGAKIYAEIVGYGMGGDANHITSPHPDGIGATYAMENALNDAKVNPGDIDYINAHATSTPVGDEIELRAVERMFADANPKLMMSATKSMTGHLLGAAGAIESVFTAMSVKHQIAPPTLNLDDPIDDVKLDLVPHASKDCKIDYAVSNSFGFGGTNVSLVMKKI